MSGPNTQWAGERKASDAFASTTKKDEPKVGVDGKFQLKHSLNKQSKYSEEVREELQKHLAENVEETDAAPLSDLETRQWNKEDDDLWLQQVVDRTTPKKVNDMLKRVNLWPTDRPTKEGKVKQLLDYIVGVA